MIHILIHEARNLQLANADTVDPIIEVKCFKKKQYTKCMDDISVNASVTWNEHIFFEPKNLSESDIQNEKICIKMNDQRMFKDAVIGMYEVDLSYIYFQDKHSIFKQWVGLSNPSVKNFNEISGYLKISASMVGPGDEQVPLDDEAGIDHTETEVMLLPPHISMKYYQFKFRIIKGQSLPKMDTYGDCDAYVQVSYLGKKIQTRTVAQKNGQVMWAQEIWLPVQAPLVSSRLVMQVIDYDSSSSDDMIGSIAFKIHEILQDSKENKEFPWKWRDIYGAPSGVSGKHTDEMNKTPEIASHWRGRILMQVVCKETDSPKMKIKNVSDKTLQAASEHMELKTYEIKTEISQGVCLPDNDLRLKIKIAELEFLTQKPKMVSKSY